MKKRAYSMTLLLVLVGTMAIGCNKQSDLENIHFSDDNTKKYSEKTGKKEDEDITVSWCIIANSKDEYYQSYWKEMKGIQAIEKVTGIQIDFKVMQDYAAYLNMFTAENYPDIITANNLSKYPGRMAGMYHDNVSIRLNDYMEEWMPNFTKIVKDYPTIGRDLRLDDGSYTYVGALYDINNTDDRIAASKFGLAIRKDWLETLGYDSVPETMDEWHEVLLSFRQNDPNGDGLPNEEPICLASSAWKYFLPAYGIDDDPSIQISEDGTETVIYGYITDAYKDYLTELRKWNSEELIYNMFENPSIEKREERILNNIAGAWKGEAHMFNTENPDSYINQLKQIVPTAEFAACPWPKTKDGYQWCYSDINSFSTDTTVITNRAVENGTDKAAAYLIDYMLGENGSTLLTWGIQGESYEIKNGEKTLLDGMDESVNFHDKQILKRYTYADPLTVMLPQFGEVSEYIQANQNSEYNQACETWSQGDTRYKVSAACQLSVEQIQKVDKWEDNMKNYISRMRNSFITGTAPMTEFDTYVAQVKELGADEYIKIWTQAYENYKNR